MKKHIARLLRKTAQRIDPQPQVHRPLWDTNTYTSSAPVKVTYR